MTRYSYEQRINRARDLAAKYAFAAKPLGFYVEVAEVQKALADKLGCLHNQCTELNDAGSAALQAADVAGRSGSSSRGDPGRERPLDFAAFTAHICTLLKTVREHGPDLLARCAAEIEAGGEVRWAALLNDFWKDRKANSEAERFFALALLQPWAEIRAAASVEIVGPTRSTCPLCGAEAAMAVLRPDLRGARRSLLCSLCATEWDCLRAVCPACGEQRAEALPVYRSEQFDHIRVDACDTCKHYLKTIDLAKNGLAIPVVDELAAIPLDIWAHGKGYTKLQTNLLGF